MLVNEAVVARHAEDTAFLWSRRQRVLRANQLEHRERARLDMRLDGHVDGLLVAGEAGWTACYRELEGWPRPETVFAAAVVAFHRTNEARLGPVLERARVNESSLAATVSAIGWNAFANLEPLLTGWALGEDPWLARLAIAGFTVHRMPPPRFALGNALRATNAPLRAAGANAVGQLGALEHMAGLHQLLADDDDEVRFQAARSLARLSWRHASVKETLLAFADARKAHAEDAAATLVRLDWRAGHSLFRYWGARAPSQRLAVLAAEVLGEAALVACLIPWMDTNDTARVAGEAFRSITGIDLASHDLTRPRPEHLEDEPSDDPDDDRVELGADYELVFPSAPKVAQWWTRHRERFAAETRYLDGKPIAFGSGESDREHTDNLRAIALAGRPRHRTLAALALAVGCSGLPTVETHAPATRVHTLPGWDAWNRLPRRSTQVRPFPEGSGEVSHGK